MGLNSSSSELPITEVKIKFSAAGRMFIASWGRICGSLVGSEVVALELGL